MEINIAKSKIFLYFCLSFALGIFIAAFLKVPILVLFTAAIFAVVAISISWRKKEIVTAGFCLIFLILGVYRYQSVSDAKSFISQFNDSKENIIFQGIVSEEPDVRIKDTQYVIKITQSSNLTLRPVRFAQGRPEEFEGRQAPFDSAHGLSENRRQGDKKDGTNITKEAINVMVSLSNHDIARGRDTKDLGKVLITLPHYPAYQYGDLIELEGKLKTPAEFDSFSYKDYLAKDGIYSVMYSPQTNLISSGNGSFIYSEIFKIKNKFKEKIQKLLPEPENSLLAGLLLGERSGLSQKLKDDFSATGTSHIMAVSGYNVTIIAIIILWLALAIGFSRAQSFWISLATIILFIIMVGAPSSAIRAGIMGGMLLLASRVGRLNSMTNAVTFAAVIMMAINPKILRFDAGFELSFLAVAGLIWLYPVLDEYFRKIPDILKIKSIFLVTISAQIMTLPVLIYNFGRLSLAAPIANILILPFVPLAMGLGFAAGAAGFIWLEFGKIIGYFTWLVLTYQIRTIEFLASSPWAATEIWNFDISLFALYYLIIAIILIKHNKKRTVSIVNVTVCKIRHSFVRLSSK